MQAFEARLLKEIAHKISLSFPCVDTVALTITYSDGTIDTYNIGGEKAGVRTENNITD